MTLPVYARFSVILVFPPGLIVVGRCDVGENRLAMNHVERILVGFRIRSRHDAEITGLGIDRAQACPLSSRCNQAMSSPSVQIFQPVCDSGGISIARLVLPQADGNAHAT